ncbi:MAG: phage terminase large subunit [Deltaproteobacteria bacterium]|nr:phage terminase large subunit [Deltaproteobacteria bacterium]
MKINFAALPAQRAFFCCQAFQAVYIGGFGAGKTYVCAMKALALAAANPGLPGLLLAPTQRMAEEVTGETLLELLAKYQVPHEYRVSTAKIIFPWGSQIRLRSADRPGRIKGLNLAWAGLDEAAQMKEAAWQILLSRVRHPQARQRQLFITTTPEGFNWVYWRFIEAPMAESQVFFAPTGENVFLDPQYKRRLEEIYPPLLAQQYLEGRFVNTTSGRVYPAFDRRLHLRPLKYDPDLPLCLAADFNVNPMLWLIIQHEGGRIFVLDEIVLAEADTGQAALEFLSRRPEARAGVEVFGDATGRRRDTRQVGRTDYAIIKEIIPAARLKVPQANPPVKDRINAVSARLKNARGEVRLTIDPSCRELIADLESLRWVQSSQGGALIDKGDPKRSHASDALGYFVARVYPIRGKVRGFKY